MGERYYFHATDLDHVNEAVLDGFEGLLWANLIDEGEWPDKEWKDFYRNYKTAMIVFRTPQEPELHQEGELFNYSITPEEITGVVYEGVEYTVEEWLEGLSWGNRNRR